MKTLFTIIIGGCSSLIGVWLGENGQAFLGWAIGMVTGAIVVSFKD